MPNSYQKLKQQLEEKYLKTSAAELDKTITIKHLDGSYFEIKNTKIVHFKNDEWVGVLTEHHNCFLYHKEDLEYYNEKEE